MAIKALPEGGKPFGEEDDENETAGENSLGKAGTGVSDLPPVTFFVAPQWGLRPSGPA
ncbi:hypothetical protein ACIBSR_03385 [Streptomyces sp. NPDC049936]|uniref:hypothetical protein n=1 Tax=Streptomyces sp. NPDC049936 TaxID=3365599 RepID=UPI003797AD36